MKTTWKTGLICLLALTMSISLMGCGDKTETREESGSSASESSMQDVESSEQAAEDSNAEGEASESDAEVEASEAESSEQAAESEAERTEDGESAESQAPAAEESSVEYGDYEVEYEETISEDCAVVIKDYFTAIEDQNFNAYKETLYDYYYNVYNTWLQDNYSYGMETAMEQMHQTLLDQAGGDGLVITSISVAEPEVESGDASSLADEYLSAYDGILGEGFAEQVKNDVDQVVVVSFTMKGTVGGGEEQVIMENYNILMVEKNGGYYVLG